MRTGPFALALLLPSLALLSACDTTADGPQTVTYRGVEVEAVGGTELEVDGNRLVVSGVEEAGDGVGFWKDYDRVALEVTPFELQAGQRFGTSVRDADDGFIASIESRGRTDGSHDIVFDLADRFGVQSVTLQYLLGSEIIYELGVPVGGQFKVRAETSGGTGNGKSNSTRVIRDGGRYVVGQDYSGDDPLAGGASGGRAEKGECPYALVTLPEVTDGVLRVCVDLVQVVVESDALPQEIRGVAVTGQGLGSFAITTLEVDGPSGGRTDVQ